MKVLSKNARVRIGADKLYCPCGGEIKMEAVFKNGKLRLQAHCLKCGRIERKPSDF